jgi:hypothetical protein
MKDRIPLRRLNYYRFCHAKSRTRHWLTIPTESAWPASLCPVLPIGAEILPGEITAQGFAVAQQLTRRRRALTVIMQGEMVPGVEDGSVARCGTSPRRRGRGVVHTTRAVPDYS